MVGSATVLFRQKTLVAPPQQQTQSSSSSSTDGGRDDTPRHEIAGRSLVGQAAGPWGGRGASWKRRWVVGGSW